MDAETLTQIKTLREKRPQDRMPDNGFIYLWWLWFKKDRVGDIERKWREFHSQLAEFIKTKILGAEILYSSCGNEFEVYLHCVEGKRYKLMCISSGLGGSYSVYQKGPWSIDENKNFHQKRGVLIGILKKLSYRDRSGLAME